MNKLVLSILLISPVLPVMAENNLSAELLFGTVNQEFTNNGYSKSGDDLSFGIRGTYSLIESFSIEGAYQIHGEIDDTYIDGFGDTINEKLSSTALSLGLKGILSLDYGISLNARVGVSFWDVEAKETDSSLPGEIFKSDDNGNDLYYGFGAQYDINSQVTFGLEYTITNMGISTETVSADYDVKNISLSLGYKF
jgi:OOP family OmpA-OmpF porin